MTNRHDVLHAMQDRVTVADTDGSIAGKRALRSLYADLDTAERARVRDIADFNMREAVRGGDLREARAWLLCVEAVAVKDANLTTWMVWVSPSQVRHLIEVRTEPGLERKRCITCGHYHSWRDLVPATKDDLALQSR